MTQDTRIQNARRSGNPERLRVELERAGLNREATPSVELTDEHALCRIEGTEIKVTDTCQACRWGRPQYEYTITLPDGTEEVGNDLYGSVAGPERSEATMLRTLLSFLGAAAETGAEGENGDLFSRDVVEWAEDHEDDISSMGYEILEAENAQRCEAWENRVSDELEGVQFFSVGSSEECEDCGDGEGEFSTSPCDSCGSNLAGSRYPAHGVIADSAKAAQSEDATVEHFEVCWDCLHYHANGELPDHLILEE